MRLVIDVSNDKSFIEVQGLQIELVNIPEDCQWKIDELRTDRDAAVARAKELEARPCTGPKYFDGTPIDVVQQVRSFLEDLKRGVAYDTAHKITLIKFARQFTGMGLKDAKDLVDSIISPLPLADVPF
jgi:Ribosomal protein L7/L12 C-terminal domain